ncbi:CobW family GTP-binding protein [Acuticoccus sp.]|uniref:CobW family GTP-binding protein n=1 Tax=Acuticoccus sp. TaxID=1904378 RepID=UPI003B520354
MVPVTLIAGFLGAGKTSLLNHVLRQPHGLRLAVLVNDFGALNIDAELLEDTGEEILALQNGCICCSLSAGLLATVSAVIRRTDPPDRILIEASGISDPAEIAQTLAEPELQPYAPLDGVVTLVDAGTAPDMTGDVLRLTERQIGMASLVVLNKSDLAGEAELEKTRSWIRSLTGAPLTQTQHGALDLGALLGLGVQEADPRSHHAAPEFESFSIEVQDPLPLERIHALLTALPPGVLRAKGVLNLREKPDHRCILQAAGQGSATLTVGPAWGDTPPASRLVLIGLKGTVRKPAVERFLHSRETCSAS